MPQTDYVETTVISYLTAWPSRDLIRAAQQQITRDWWANQGPRFDLYSSQLVVLEAAAGDQVAAGDRLRILATMPMLDISEDALRLARQLIHASALPAIALRDAEHVGICATNGMDFLLTWNCRHLANAKQRDRIIQVCADFDLRAPTICTPEELFGDDHE
jgi:hypothetical protein